MPAIIGLDYTASVMLVDASGAPTAFDLGQLNPVLNIDGATAAPTNAFSTTGQMLGVASIVLTGAEMTGSRIEIGGTSGEGFVVIPEIVRPYVDAVPNSALPPNFSSMAILSGSGYTRCVAELYYDPGFDDYRVYPSNFQILVISGSGVVDAHLANADHGGNAATLLLNQFSASTALVDGGSLIVSGTGANQLSPTLGQVIVATNHDKDGYALTGAYDAAKTAAQAGDAMAMTTAERNNTRSIVQSSAPTLVNATNSVALTTAEHTTLQSIFGTTPVLLQNGTGTGQIVLNAGTVTVGTNNDKTGYSGNATNAPAATAIRAEIDSNSTQLQALRAGVNATNSGLVVSASNAPTVVQIRQEIDSNSTQLAKLGSPAGASVSADIAAVKTDTGNLVTRITSTLFSGITSLKQWLGLILGKQTADSTALTEVRSTGAGSGTYDPTTDSQEAIRDRGDAAWVTGDLAGALATVGLTDASQAATYTQQAAIKAQTDKIGTNSADSTNTQTMQSRVDAAVSSRQPSGNVTVGGYAGGQAPPSVSDVRSEIDAHSTQLLLIVNRANATLGAITGTGVMLSSNAIDNIDKDLPTTISTATDLLRLAINLGSIKISAPTDGNGVMTLYGPSGDVIATRQIVSADGNQTLGPVSMS